MYLMCVSCYDLGVITAYTYRHKCDAKKMTTGIWSYSFYTSIESIEGTNETGKLLAMR